MGYVIRAISDEDIVVYSRKSRKTVYLDGISYKYYDPVFKDVARVYSNYSHCSIAKGFLEEQLKRPVVCEGIVVWKDYWSLEIIDSDNCDGCWSW